MNKGPEVARGKTKILYQHPERADAVIVSSQDQITAGDGAKRDVIGGKGRLAALTTARIFRLLNACGVPSHYLSGGEDEDQNEMIVRRCEMIPIEVVVRGVAAGSYLKRHPEVKEGAVFAPRLVEYFFKDDARHDPQYSAEQIIAEKIASAQELEEMTDIARLTFEILVHAWKTQNVLLVDLKVEFGRCVGADGNSEILLADVIDNDSWRIWPAGDSKRMLDKQLYRNMSTPTDSQLGMIKEKYEEVADRVGQFQKSAGGFVAIIMGSAADLPHAERISKALSALGIPSMKHVASAHKTPLHALARVEQTDSTMGHAVYITIAGRSNALSAFVDAATPNPVIACPVIGSSWAGMEILSSLQLPSGVASLVVLEPENAALAAAKILGADDTVIYGRVLVSQYRSRKNVIESDARLNSAPPNGKAGA
ncbi:MAG: AIR carboxylase family protein [Candidatus Eremiobacteraeota bacterium]|nr:AIR carboxylase family protein [Candidatus Eremiobacteraeota bacterium]MBV8366129.1 AIR carboxylase family protein [Candidatus Eremiobacteraeota bacterium]